MERASLQRIKDTLEAQARDREPRFAPAMTAMVMQHFVGAHRATASTRYVIADFWDGAIRNGFVDC